MQNASANPDAKVIHFFNLSSLVVIKLMLQQLGLT